MVGFTYSRLVKHHAALCHMMLVSRQHGRIYIFSVSGNALSCFLQQGSQNMHGGSGGGVMEVGGWTVQPPEGGGERERQSKNERKRKKKDEGKNRECG